MQCLLNISFTTYWQLIKFKLRGMIFLWFWFLQITKYVYPDVIQFKNLLGYVVSTECSFPSVGVHFLQKKCFNVLLLPCKASSLYPPILGFHLQQLHLLLVVIWSVVPDYWWELPQRNESLWTSLPYLKKKKKQGQIGFAVSWPIWYQR